MCHEEPDGICVLCITKDELQAIALAHRQQRLTPEQIEQVIKQIRETLQNHLHWKMQIKCCVEETILKTAYEKWLSAVGEWMYTEEAVNVDDLPAHDFYALFVNGSKPDEAAKIMLYEVFHA